MKKIKIFISSVQKEFAEERMALSDYLLHDSLLGRFFEPFLFEQLSAKDRTAEQVFLSEVERCDIYLGILGKKYGYEDKDGVSPTEKEFEYATKHHKTRLIFILNTKDRDSKEKLFINKVQTELVRKSFEDSNELKTAVYSALVNYLIDKEIVRTAPFDASINRNASLDDIDPEKVTNFIRLAKLKRGFPLPESTQIKTLLTHLNLMQKDNINNAAILLFGRNPQRFFITSEIRCASFYGNRVEKPIPSYKVFKGDVFELVDQALEFVLNKLNYSIGTREEHVQIPGSYEIPKDVIAEAIVNAVVHRDYNSNASVQVMVFRDRVEIWNPGSLPMGWTTKKLKELHNSVPANPLLAEPMYLTAYIERIGTGTTDIVNKCKDAGLPEPEFMQEDMFRTILYRKPTPEVTPEVTPDVTPDVAKLIMILKGDMSRTEIMKVLKLKDEKHFREHYQQLAIKQGFVEMSIPDKPRSSKQKYRLTEKGLKVKNKLKK